MTKVTLSREDIEQADEFARRVVERYTHDDGLHGMPWTLAQFTAEQLREWLASRKAAGEKIDCATCEIGWWWVDEVDPYGIGRALGETFEIDGVEVESINRCNFVRSPDSNGWVTDGDLPPASIVALYERIARDAAAQEPDYRRIFVEVFGRTP
jgi:hypothetical protein